MRLCLIVWDNFFFLPRNRVLFDYALKRGFFFLKRLFDYAKLPVRGNGRMGASDGLTVTGILIWSRSCWGAEKFHHAPPA